MNWLAPVAKHCHIYHKGNKVIPHRQWETLPNVEREGRTYLHHIINKSDYLDDITVFLQGSLDKEKQYGRAYINISDYITLAQKNQITCSDHRDSYKLWGRTIGLQQKLSIANVTFGEFWQTVFGYPHPSSIKVCFGGCFSVIRTLIQQHQIAFYKKSIPYVSHSRDPLEGHYLE